MRFVVLGSRDFQHGNVQAFVQSLARALRAEGAEVLQRDWSGPADNAAVAATIEDKTLDAIVTFTAHATDPTLEESRNVYNRTRAALVDVYLDPLLLYLGRLDPRIRRRVVACTSDDGLEAIRPLVFPGHPILLLPHAADPLDPVPWAARDVDLLFAGSLSDDPDAIRTAWRGRGEEGALLSAMAEEALGADPPPLLELVFGRVAAAGGDTTIRRRQALALELDRYLRARLRFDTVAQLLDLPLTVVGAGWDRLAATGGRARFLGPKPATEVRAMTARARLVLNAMPAYHGSHERIVDAMAAGAGAVSNRGGWLATAFPDAALRLFRPGPDAAKAAVSPLLESDAAARDLAEAGRAALVAGHTWRHRARALMAWLPTAT